ncbi:MAG: VCBS repeat-containing protein [Proteobacteria bacterium]|nr:VCBS repeat-containing protein [Pseudomonadota bacterium]MDA0995200.1 VCBS repeat-containing protein [Pseudomonadota bacterium]
MVSRLPAALRHRKGQSIRSPIAVAFISIVVMSAISAAHAQALVIENFSNDANKDVARTTADWNIIDSALKLPRAASLTGLLFNGSAAVDAFDLTETRAVAVGDLNGDGFLDIAFGDNGANTVYFNNGFGAFTRGSAVPNDATGNTRSAVIEDFNGDGYPDLLFAEFGTAQASRIHFNNGSGSVQVFTQGEFVLLGSATLKGDSAAAGDVDGDGDIDVVLGIDGGYVKLFRNNGSGNFSAPEDIVDTDSPDAGYRVRSVLIGDVDRDGDLDIVSAREFDATRIHLNNGAGNFSSVPQSAGLNVLNSLSSPDSIALGDVNGDGFLDLFVGNDGSTSSPAPQRNATTCSSIPEMRQISFLLFRPATPTPI